MMMGGREVPERMVVAYALYVSGGPRSYRESTRTAMHDDILRAAGFTPTTIRKENTRAYRKFTRALEAYVHRQWQRQNPHLARRMDA
jgi:hypothetical protein